jgi:hypothetical protein
MMRGRIGPIARHISGLVLLGTGLTFALTILLTLDVPAAPSAAEQPSESVGEQFKRFMTTPSVLEKVSLDRLVKGTSADDPKQRHETSKLILSASPADARKLHTLLHRKTRVSAAGYKNLLRQVGAQVPNHRGRFTRPARIKDLNWLGALEKLKSSAVSSHLRRAHGEALLSVALMRALAKTGHHDAAISLLRFGYRHGGAFRDECGRQIRAMGVQAVPSLLRARALKDPLAYKMKRYAAYQLDRMDLTRPSRVLRQADPDLQAELLHAYGEVRAGSAVNAVLGKTNANSAKVRLSARWAMLRYVSGRPPRVVRRKLKLAGGRQTSSARTLYLNYRQLAGIAIVDRLAKELAAAGGPSEADLRKRFSEEDDPRYLAERLFKHLDQQRERSRKEQLDLALKRAEGGELKRAVAAFDRVLAENPFHPRRGEMARHYYARGQQLLKADKPGAAVMLLTKAVLLHPAGTFAERARAQLALAEARTAKGSAATRKWQLITVIARSPKLQAARKELESIQRNERRRVWLAAGIGGAAAVLVILALMIVRRRLR